VLDEGIGIAVMEILESECGLTPYLKSDTKHEMLRSMTEYHSMIDALMVTEIGLDPRGGAVTHVAPVVDDPVPAVSGV
jgi:hypothetical protein